MLRKIFLVCMAMLVFIFSYAQSDSTKPTSPSPTITGSVDGYYRFNFNDPPKGMYNNYTSFTNSQNSFELGMASIRADHSFGKASATIDLGFGRRAEEFSYANPDHPTLFAVKQAYINFAASDKVTFTLGKWATHIGYEVTDAYLNRNYSMDYMFSYGPFSHTGIKAQITTGEKSALMLGFANSTDNVADDASPKYLLAQFSTGTKNDKVKVYANYQGSYNYMFNKTQFDLVVTGTVSDKFSVGYNGTVQSYGLKGGSSDSWWGSAVYLNLDPTAIFGITLRGEYFDDKNAIVLGTSVFDLTLSPNIRIDNLTIIPELRFDSAKDEIFAKTDGTATKSTVTGLLAATYHF
jgi:Putative beta-barrel porin-2, OmpL-like. bbp2